MQGGVLLHLIGTAGIASQNALGALARDACVSKHLPHAFALAQLDAPKSEVRAWSHECRAGSALVEGRRGGIRASVAVSLGGVR